MSDKLMNLQVVISEKQEELRTLEEQYEREAEKQSKVARLFDEKRLASNAITVTDEEIGKLACNVTAGQIAGFLGECFERDIHLPDEVVPLPLSHILIAMKESGITPRKSSNPFGKACEVREFKTS